MNHTPVLNQAHTKISFRLEAPPPRVARTKLDSIIYLQSKLNYPGPLGGSHSPESGIVRLVASTDSARAGKVELSVVKGVEKLRPEFDPKPLRYMKILQ